MASYLVLVQDDCGFTECLGSVHSSLLEEFEEKQFFFVHVMLAWKLPVEGILACLEMVSCQKWEVRAGGDLVPIIIKYESGCSNGPQTTR